MNTYVKDTGIRGRGVFASRSLRKGQLVERAHAIIIPNRDIVSGAAIAHCYTYAWSQRSAAIATGTALLYNHSNVANVEWDLEKATSTIAFYALRAVKRGEELTIYYSDDPMLLRGDRARQARGKR